MRSHSPVIFLIVFGMHFVLNFWGGALLKYYYLLEVGLVLSVMFRSPFMVAFPYIATLLLIEGQGRVLWSYHFLFRMLFDLALALLVIKNAIKDKRIVDFDKIPQFLVILFVIHLGHYCVQIFNIDSVGPLGVLAASKVYVFPSLFFFMLLAIDIKIDENFELAIKLLLAMAFLESVLSIHQMMGREATLLKISSYYSHSLKDGAFSGLLFRPYGTTHLPGAISIYLTLLIGLLYLREIKSGALLLARHLTVFAGAITIFLTQVRSALVKYVLILLLIQLGTWLISQHKVKKVFSSAFILGFLLLGLNLGANFEGLEKLNIQSSINRLMSFKDLSSMKDQRISLDHFMKVVTEKLAANPLGLGPGRTGAAAGISKEIIKKDLLYNELASWTYDNFFISLVIDLGLGGIIYGLIFCSLPLLLLYYTFGAYRRRHFDHYRVLLVCSSVTMVMLIGNWGAVGLSYNPESFVFWFFSALGLNHHFEEKGELLC